MQIRWLMMSYTQLNITLSIQIDLQRWSLKLGRLIVLQKTHLRPLILGRSGTQYVAMATELLSSNCGAHLVESYCKESNISDTNWLRYLFFIIFVKFGWAYDVTTWLICIFWKLEYLWNKKRYLKIVNSI